MRTFILSIGLVASGWVGAHNSNETNSMIHHETIICDAKDGCEVICRQPGDRWDSYLKTEGNIEVTYFLTSGVRQLKADMGKGNYTILDTHPELQSCRITGVK
jgi:allophanate hydrolase subunit 2